MNDDNPTPEPKRRGVGYWAEAISTALLAVVVVSPFLGALYVIGAKLTESSPEATLLFAISSTAFGVSVMILLFWLLRFYLKSPPS